MQLWVGHGVTAKLDDHSFARKSLNIGQRFCQYTSKLLSVSSVKRHEVLYRSILMAPSLRRRQNWARMLSRQHICQMALQALPAFYIINQPRTLLSSPIIDSASTRFEDIGRTISESLPMSTPALCSLLKPIA